MIFAIELTKTMADEAMANEQNTPSEATSQESASQERTSQGKASQERASQDVRRCTICKTGRLGPGTTTMTLERGETTIVLKEVPGLVCDTCGEGYTDGEVTDRVLEIAEQAATQGVQFDVRRYVPADDEPADDEMERAA